VIGTESGSPRAKHLPCSRSKEIEIQPVPQAAFLDLRW
jgi:hypothetical protein